MDTWERLRTQDGGRNEMYHCQTGDPDEFEEFISRAAPGVRIAALRPPPLDIRSRATPLARSAIFSAQVGSIGVTTEGPSAFFSITVPLDRPLEVVCEGKTRTFAPGTAHLLNLNDDFDCRVRHGGNVLVASLLPPLIDKVVAKLRGVEEATPLRLSNGISLQSAGGRNVWRLLSFLWDEAIRGGGLLSTPLVAEELESTLFTALVLAVDQDSDGRLLGEAKDCPPAYLGRAEDYMASNLKNALSLADIAQAAGVSARTIIRGFRKRHGTSPMAFLRQLRLEQVQRELLAADPACETVTAVATRYGFFELGRFAEYYRKAFDELPSETLRK